MTGGFAAGRRELVLVGGGHAHVQVLRRFAVKPPPRCRLTVVVDTPVAVYSGMVPGFVAGQYRARELEIDVLPLARRAGARVIMAAAEGVDPGRGRIAVAGRPSVPYDVASFDIGSTVAGLELPGIRAHALPTRPIGRFVLRVDELVEKVRRGGRDPARLVVVGGGAGGVELAFCLEQRLREEGVAARITLIQNRERVLPGYPDSLVRRVRRAAVQRGIEILCNAEVEAAAEGAVALAGGERLTCDGLVWVTGAVSHGILRGSGLPTDSRGFVHVRATLQIQGHDNLFAVGDCATLLRHPRTPKAGVYAVRQGPYVADNLRSFLAGGPLRSYVPQRDFLALLNLGDGTALGAKWGRSIEGEWVMRLKDRIDRAFMRRFQVLDEDGALTGEFGAEPDMSSGSEMLCGGCAAKVGESVLRRVLERLGPGEPDPSVALGLREPDDVGAYRVAGGPLVVTSLDAFRSFTDDPWLVGRVAALNALSDVEAKGVVPRYALALAALPDDSSDEEREEMLFQLLAGARESFERLDVTLLGGHSTTAPELMVGFAVDGVVRDASALLRIDGLEEGQTLILTKPLGTGVLLRADAAGRARGPWILAAFESMLRGNGPAARVAVEHRATAATDVTGFGLAGHLAAMLRASGVGAVLELGSLPVLPGAADLLHQGLRSTFHDENARAGRAMLFAADLGDDPRSALIFDPQTCGGLLFGLPSEEAASALTALHQGGDSSAAAIGRVTAGGEDGARIEVRE